ncbi:MAG: VOC family protein [Minisyncoccia bacterium]
MHYLHTMVRVSNLEKSLDFYCRIFGLVEFSRRDDEKGRYTNVFLRAPGDTPTEAHKAPLLELTYNWPPETGEPERYTNGRNFGHLCYAVDNIYDFCERLQKEGIMINRPPRDGRMAFVRSPDGISIELLQIGESLPLQEPWASAPNVGTW